MCSKNLYKIFETSFTITIKSFKKNYQEIIDFLIFL
jgi:hypothetical protein